MYVRCKRNKSGSTSVQIIDKSSGEYPLFQTVGSSSDPREIEAWSLLPIGARVGKRLTGS